MAGPFGAPVPMYSGDAADGSSTTTAHEDMDLVRRTLVGFNEGGAGFLRFYRPVPTAAFSPSDKTLDTSGAAAEAMRARGFEPVERRAGGQLAIYDGNALVIDLVASHDDPREHVIERFQLFSRALATVLAGFGIDARIGAIAGEYCPGDYSVNGEGRVKLAGLAQRIARRGYHLGAVISVTHSGHAMSAVSEAYRILGLPFLPETFGAASDLVPHLQPAVLFQRLHDAVTIELLVLQGTAAARDQQLPDRRRTGR